MNASFGNSGSTLASSQTVIWQRDVALELATPIEPDASEI
jgi:hypothetical protein